MHLSFCGGAKEVGASCILLRLDGKNILLDAGIRLNHKDALPNFRMIQESGGVDAILISHGHMDHMGSLPAISREYPNALIYMSHPSKDITKVLLFDSLKIMEHRETEIPAYAPVHVEEMLKRIVCYSFEYTFFPFQDKDIQVTFYQAGHILGASAIYIQGKEGSIFYSGDFSATPQQTIGGIHIPKLRPDVMLTESTYGDKLHASRKTEEDRLVEIVRDMTAKGGKILIPAFAVGRAQEVILILKRAMNKGILPKIPVYVDGMVKDICRIYKLNPNYLKADLAKKVWKEKEIFYDDDVQPVETMEMRREIIESSKPCCIIASSGMLTGGPSLFYAEHLMKEEKNFIAITGYQDEEAPGRQLLALLDEGVEKERVFTIGDREWPVRCGLGKYGLSAHGDKGEILGIIQKLAPRRIFFLHGNSEAIGVLGKEAQLLGNGKVYLPQNGEQYEITFENPRKQLKKHRIPSLEKGNWPKKEDMAALWNYLKGREIDKGYTLEELTYLWSGRLDFDEEILKELQLMVYESPYFEQDRTRLFLYHPVKEEALKNRKENLVMEVNEMLQFAEKIFPKEAGLYKKGARQEEKIALLYFNFPSVALKRYGEEMKRFETETGWKVEVNVHCNLSALEAYLHGIMKEEKNILLKTSYYQMENLLKVKCSRKPLKEMEIIEDFQENTGVRLAIEYPEKAMESAAIPMVEDNPSKMEQNAALALIDQVFANSGDKIYKKSIKTVGNGKYIELSFVSAAVGERYMDWIKDLEQETGWSIKVNQIPNQMELIKTAISLLQEENIVPKKNPSILQMEQTVKVKLEEVPQGEIRQKLQREFYKLTGFRLELEYI